MLNINISRVSLILTILFSILISFNDLSIGSNHKDALIKRIGRGTINDIAAHPSKEVIAIGGSRGIWLYSFALDDLTHFGEDHDNSVEAVQWSPNGNFIAVTRPKKGIQIWEVATENLIQEFPTLHEYRPQIMHWGPDNGYIAIAQGDTSDRIYIDIHNIHNGIREFQFESQNPINDIDWHPHGDKLLGLHSQGITVWDIPTQVEIARYRSEENYLVSAEWRSGADVIAIVGQSPEQSVILWDYASQNTLASYAYDGYLSQARWSRGGTYLAAIDTEGVIILWDLSNKKRFFSFPLNSTDEFAADKFTWDSQGEVLIAANIEGAIRIWDVERNTLIGEYIGNHNWPVDKVIWLAEQNLIVSAEHYEHNISVKFWDASTSELVKRFFAPLGGTINALRWNPNRKLVLASYSHAYPEFYDTILWDLTGNQIEKSSMLQHTGNVIFADWSIDGSRLITISSSDSRSINIWNDSIDYIDKSLVADDTVVAVALDQSSQELAILSSGNRATDNRLEIMNLETGQARTSFTVPDTVYAFIPPLLWNPQSNVFLVVGRSRGGDAIWVVNAIAEQLSEKYDIGASDIAWNQESDLVAAAGCTVNVVNLQNRQIVPIYDGESCAFSVSWGLYNQLAVGFSSGRIDLYQY